jgi:hypothetical protein
MRKIGAISLAAFYLMLTTGMFVCLIHCGTEYLLAKTVNQTAQHDADNEGATPAGHHHEHDKSETHHHKNSCGKGKDCSCCNRHGNYVIKENINSTLAFQLTALQAAVYPTPYQSLAPIQGIHHEKNLWLNATGPPILTNQPLYISYRSLLI